MSASLETEIKADVLSASDLSTVLVRVAAGASVVAGIFHYAAVPEHRAEWLLAAVFFTFLAAFQIVWAALIHGDDRYARAFWWAGVVVNVAALALWLVSRTTGLPFGPEPGEAESIGFLDTVCVAAEFITVVALLAARGLPSRHPSPADSPTD